MAYLLCSDVYVKPRHGFRHARRSCITGTQTLNVAAEDSLNTVISRHVSGSWISQGCADITLNWEDERGRMKVTPTWVNTNKENTSKLVLKREEQSSNQNDLYRFFVNLKDIRINIICSAMEVMFSPLSVRVLVGWLTFGVDPEKRDRSRSFFTPKRCLVKQLWFG